MEGTYWRIERTHACSRCTGKKSLCKAETEAEKSKFFLGPGVLKSLKQFSLLILGCWSTHNCCIICPDLAYDLFEAVHWKAKSNNDFVLSIKTFVSSQEVEEKSGHGENFTTFISYHACPQYVCQRVHLTPSVLISHNVSHMWNTDLI